MKGRGVKTKVAGVTLVITSFLGKRGGEREGGGVQSPSVSQSYFIH